MTEREYYCDIDNWELTEYIVNSGSGVCGALHYEYHDCKTCEHLKEKR